MHRIVRILVESKNAEEAIAKAKEVLDGLVGRDVFDYYVTFDEPGSPCCGAGRWGKMQPAARHDEYIFDVLLRDGIEFTRQEKLECLRYMREALDKCPDDKDIVDHTWDETVSRHMCMFEYYAFHFGEYAGNSGFVFVSEYESIDNIKEYLNWMKYVEDKNNVWIVPADVHW